MKLIAALILLGSASTLFAQSVPFVQLLERNKVCEGDEGVRQCTYRAGKDLQFTITGIGGSLTGVVFNRSSFEGDYYASIAFSIGCVMVHGGKSRPSPFSELAFVSPNNGKVYATGEECQTRGKAPNSTAERDARKSGARPSP